MKGYGNRAKTQKIKLGWSFQKQMVSIDEAITQRRSIRAFDPQRPVPRETIYHLLRLAGRAPSGSNIQPWRVWVAEDDTLKAITDVCLARHNAGDAGQRPYNYYPVTWRSPYIERRRATGWGLYNLLNITRENKQAMHEQHARNYKFFDAPVGLFFSIDQDMEIGSWLDFGMFLQTLMLAAIGSGLATCPQAAFCNYHDSVKPILGIPDDQIFVCGMSLGYPLADAEVNNFQPERLDPKEFTTFV